MATPSRATGCFVWGFLALWTLLVLGYAGAVGWGLVREVGTYRFAETDGVVTVNRLVRSGKKSWRLELAYDYRVGGQEYTGTRYSHLGGGGGGRSPAVQREFPVGKRVPVYYDPADPGDAVMHRGITGTNLFFLWLVTPFAAVMVGGWMYLWVGGRSPFDPENPAHVTPTPTGWRVRLPGLHPVGAFALTLFAVTFLGLLVILAAVGPDPPPGMMLAAFAGAFALAAVSAALSRPRWLEVDELARTLRLSAGRVEVPFGEVAGVAVSEVVTPRSKGPPARTYPVDLRRADGGPHRLGVYRDRVSADRFAGWLRKRVGRPDAVRPDG